MVESNMVDRNLHQSELQMNRKLKLFIKNNAFRISQKVAIKRLEKIISNSNPQTVRTDGKKILFNLVYGMYGKLIFWECGLAKALQMRGHDVKALVCGGAFTMCTSEYTIQSVHDDITCKTCVDFSRNFLNTVGIPYSTYKEYISDEEMENIKKRVNQLSINECKNLTYKGVKVGTLSMNSVIRYFKGSLNPDKNKYESVLRSELINAIISTDAAEKVVKEEKPDILVTRHLGYSSWGSFADYFKKKGLRVCSPGEGYSPTTIHFIMNDVKNEFSRYLIEIRKNKMLNEGESKHLDVFLNNRFKGLFGDTIDYEFTEHQINNDDFDFDKYEKTYAIFPNVPWDSSLLNANMTFNTVHEWLSYTIDLFKKKPNHQLIIKIHPSETKVMKSEHTVLDFIKLLI